MLSPVEEIKSRLDIAEFIQSYVRLEKAGVNFRARCPFHNEKTPSFFVSPARQIWHCFGGCGEGGDIFKFVMKIEGVEFPEALKLLAQKAGVELKREDPRIRTERNRLYDICEIASRWFVEQRKRRPEVIAYLKKRGLNDETIEEFDIGFAPESWHDLVNFLTAKGFKPDEIERAGLAIKGQARESWQSRWHDRFRSRIMFPISDSNGRVIGFGGRIFQEIRNQKPETNGADAVADEHTAKYINTPNTLIYDKSRAIYAFDKAKQEIRKNDSVVVVEGYMDAVMSHQAGVKNTIAVSGTALTEWQLNSLRRLAKTMISSFDSDAAGENATKKSLDLAAGFDFERRVAVIPSGKDPADSVLENPASWVEAVKNAKPIVEFFVERAFKKFDKNSVEGKKLISAYLLPELASLENEIEKSHWVSFLSAELGVREDSIWEELRKVQKPKEFLPPEGEDVGGKVQPRRKLLEESMLSMMAAFPAVRGEFPKRDFYVIFSNTDNESLFNYLKQDSSAASVRPELVDAFRFRGEVFYAGLADIKKEFAKVLSEFERECVREKLDKISGELALAEKKKDAPRLDALLAEFKILSEKLK